MSRAPLAAVLAAAVLGVLLLAAPASAGVPSAGGALPKGFLWGQALAGFQADMGRGRDLDRGSDWWAWTHDAANRTGRVTSGDLPEDGPGFWARYRADVRLARRGTGANLFRFGIEWSRVFPHSTAVVRTGARLTTADLRRLDRLADPAAIRHYRALLQDIRRHGMRPFATIQHFTLPRWIHDPIAARRRLAALGPNDDIPAFKRAGWLDGATVDEFGKYAGYLAWKLGDLVDLWAPVNEPMVVAANGYANIPGVLAGNFPPGAFTFTGAITAVRNLERANAVAYDAVKRLDRADADRDGGASRVGLVQNMVGFTPADPGAPRDVAGAEHAEYLFNRLFVTAAVRGDIDENADGTIQPGERARHGRKADFVGVNYYFRGRVTGLGAPVTPRIPVLDFLPATTYRWALAPQAPACPSTCSDFGNELYAEGFARALQTAGSYGLPVFVTENGIADAGDRTRPGFLRDHLRVMRQAITDRTADVHGYIHWSLTDNFEWVAGYTPKFGLYAVDRRTLKRTPRSASVRLLRTAARTNRVP